MLVWPEERADDVVVAVVVVGVGADVGVDVGVGAKPGSRLDLMQQWQHKRWKMIRVQFEEKPALKKNLQMKENGKQGKTWIIFSSQAEPVTQVVEYRTL